MSDSSVPCDNNDADDLIITIMIIIITEEETDTAIPACFYLFFCFLKGF